MSDLEKRVAELERKIKELTNPRELCLTCYGTGKSPYLQVWHGVIPPPARPCPTCHGTGVMRQKFSGPWTITC